MNTPAEIGNGAMLILHHRLGSKQMGIGLAQSSRNATATIAASLLS